MNQKKELNVTINMTIPLSTAMALQKYADTKKISIQDAVREVLKTID